MYNKHIHKHMHGNFGENIWSMNKNKQSKATDKRDNKQTNEHKYHTHFFSRRRKKKLRKQNARPQHKESEK